MREIKFRFWDKDLNKMCEGKPAYNDFSHPNILPMQFTGLRDCFGIEIYEGDTLVDVDTELEEGVKLQDTQQQVYWCEKIGCWKLDNTFIQDASSGYLLANDLKDFRFRVYSNIYSKAWEEKNKATTES